MTAIHHFTQFFRCRRLSAGGGTRYPAGAWLSPVVAFLVLLFAMAAPAAYGADLWTLHPRIVTTGEPPETWTLDLRGKSEEEAREAASRISWRLFSSGILHEPLVIRSDFSEPKVLGLHIAGISRRGAGLVIRKNGEELHHREWGPGSTGQRPNVLFHLPLPAGPVDLSLEATSGMVVIDAYFIATSEEHLPTNLVPLAFDSPEEISKPGPLPGQPSYQTDGYRGIWYTLRQFSEHGAKYSGGLGTYTANHRPMAVYAPEVDKTFFVYGGSVRGRRHLQAMASYYDHENHRVPRPTVVHDRRGVVDAHDNPSLMIDGDGHVWVFVAGRSRRRDGSIYRSVRPYDVSEFEFIREAEFTYPQPKYVEGEGYFHLFTKYTRGRELYWATSEDGREWSEDRKLAGIRGHYQVSAQQGNTIGTFFNRHPGSVDRRTDVYYVQTTDFGETWTMADGTPVDLPLETEDNAARVIDYASQERLMYTVDLNFDGDGHPVLLYVRARRHRPGPENDPREWVVTRWTGDEWVSHVVTASTHNYDFGALYIEEEVWRIIGPTEAGPQRWGTGGEIALWVSRDRGETWSKERDITRDSEFNHGFSRRPKPARDPFYSFWADGHAERYSESRLYFGNSDGTRYWKLSYDMEGEYAEPIPMNER